MEVARRRRVGAFGALIQGARLAYNNRDRIQRVAEQMRAGYRNAKRAYNRFKSSSSARRSKFKPSAWTGRGGRGGRRGRKPTRRGRRRGSGRFRKGKGKGLMKKIYNDLYPLKQMKSHCIWRGEVDATAYAGYTSMEVGNYLPGGVTPGQGCQSPFNSKPISTAGGTVNNSGTINSIISSVLGGDDMLVGQKRWISNVYLSINCQNASNNPVHVAAYTCKWRRCEGSEGYMTLEQKFKMALIAGGISSLNGVTPFMLPQFTSQHKILKVQRKKLLPGEECYFNCVSPMRGNHTYEALIDEPITDRWTRGILLVFYGALSADTTQHSYVSSGPAALNLKATCKQSYRIINSTTRTTKFSNFQFGTVTLPEVNPLNMNNPGAYME